MPGFQEKKDAFVIRIDMKAVRAFGNVVSRDSARHQPLKKIRFIIFFFISRAQASYLYDSLFRCFGRIDIDLQRDAGNAFQFCECL